MIKISVRVTDFELRCLEEIVKRGHFENVSAAVRAAVDRMIRKYLLFSIQ